MTRVGTFSQSQTLAAEMMRLQQQQFQTQQQIATGKVADQFKDIAQEANVLLSAKGVEAQLATYTRAAQEVTGRIDMQDLQLDSLSTVADDLRQSVTTAVANESGIVLMETLEQAFDTSVNLLNAQYNGQYIYSGTRTETPAVSAGSLADLVAATAAGDVFENNDLKSSVQIDDNEAIEYGVLADEVAEPFFAAIKRIAEYDAGPNGPFGEQLTQDQRAYLESELSALVAASTGINEHVAANGLNHTQVQDAAARHEKEDVFIKGFISDIEDVDLAEAVSQLNNDQVAVEAATRVVAQLTRLSLLDFI